MRIATIKIGLALSLCSLNGFAVDLTLFENQCAEIGFTRNTPAFGNCVLDLHSREFNSNPSQKLYQQPASELSRQNELSREALEEARKARQEAATARREADEYRKRVEAQKRQDQFDEQRRLLWDSNEKAMRESWRRP